MANRIHPAATVDPAAELGDGIEIGPHAVVEGQTIVGDGCRLMAGSVVRRFTRMGRGNVLHPCAVLGGEPQDLKFDPRTESWVIIGDHNVFREGATVHRGTGEGTRTIIADHNYLMTAAHVGHNCTVGSNCVMVNGSALGGHVELHDRAILSAHVSVHQFCWIGEMVMSQGNGIATQHVPPYCMIAGFGEVVGLNRVGLRRAAHLTDEDRRQIQDAFRLLYRRGLTMKGALEEMEARTGWGPAAGRFRDFVRRVAGAGGPHRRGLATLRHRRTVED